MNVQKTMRAFLDRRIFSKRWVLTTLLLACMCPAMRAQRIVHRIEGDPGDNLARVRRAGDVNVDGFADVIASSAGGGIPGVVRVYSGFDGRILHEWHGTLPNQHLGTSIDGAGDVNGDGHADLIVGASDGQNGPFSGSARVFSGKDGSLLHWFHGDGPNDGFGSVAGAGDLNGDGYADVMVGGPRTQSSPLGGYVRIFSGFDGSLLLELHGSPGESFGAALAAIGDVTGDGVGDIVVGSPHATTIAGSHSGRITVFSGLNGTALYTSNGSWPGSHFGLAVAGAGDVNGDGILDLIAGGPNDNSQGFNVGMARVLSGPSGLVLHEWYGTTVNNIFGGTVAGMGDLNGDGYADLGVTAYEGTGSGTGSALFFSGRDGSLLYTLGPETVGQGFLSVATAGDVTGNGHPDIVLGGYNLVSVYAGFEHIVPFCFGDGSGSACPCGNAGGAGEGCASSSGVGAILVGTGTASVLRADLALVASQLLPGRSTLLFFGENAVNGGAGAHFGDGLRCAGGSVRRLGVALPDAEGGALFEPTLDSLGAPAPGERGYFQAWYRDPIAGPCGFGFNLTNGVEVAFSL